MICEEDFDFEDIIVNNGGTGPQKALLFSIMKMFVNPLSPVFTFFSTGNNDPHGVYEKIEQFFNNKKFFELHQIYDYSEWSAASGNIIGYCHTVYQAGIALGFASIHVLDKLYTSLAKHSMFANTLQHYNIARDEYTYESFTTCLNANYDHYLLTRMSKPPPRGQVNTFVQNPSKVKATRGNAVKKPAFDSKLKCDFKKTNGQLCGKKGHTAKTCHFNPANPKAYKCTNVNCANSPYGHTIDYCSRPGGGKAAVAKE
jgi:hypothetical protein